MSLTAWMWALLVLVVWADFMVVGWEEEEALPVKPTPRPWISHRAHSPVSYYASWEDVLEDIEA